MVCHRRRDRLHRNRRPSARLSLDSTGLPQGARGPHRPAQYAGRADPGASCHAQDPGHPVLRRGLGHARDGLEPLPLRPRRRRHARAPDADTRRQVRLRRSGHGAAGPDRPFGHGLLRLGHGGLEPAARAGGDLDQRHLALLQGHRHQQRRRSRVGWAQRRRGSRTGHQGRIRSPGQYARRLVCRCQGRFAHASSAHGPDPRDRTGRRPLRRVRPARRADGPFPAQGRAISACAQWQPDANRSPPQRPRRLRATAARATRLIGPSMQRWPRPWTRSRAASASKARC